MSFTQEEIDRFIAHANEHKPWKEYPDIWKSESAYWTWIRGRLRQLWTRWIPRNKLKMASRKKVKVLDGKGKPIRYKTGKNKGKIKTRYEIKCQVCKGMFPQSQVEADHIEPSGKCSNAVEACTFLYRLLVSSDKLRMVCKTCHKIITYADKMGITFEESKAKKVVIELMKKSVAKQKSELRKHGFAEGEIKNKAAREACYVKLVKNGEI